MERLAKSPFAIIPLGKFLSPKNGIRYGTGTPPPIVEPSKTSLPFIRATDIKGGEILVDGLLHIDSEQGQHMKKCLVEAGEMILVRSGANTGDCAVVPKSLAGSYAAYDLIVRFSTEALPDYVAAYLDTEIGRAQMNVLKGRAAQPHINAEEVSSVRIPKPPIEFQRKLVSELEAARIARKQKLAEADALLASLDTYLLAQLGLTKPLGEDRKFFAVRLSQVKERLDPKYFLHREHKSNAGVAKNMLAHLTVAEPEYGSGARAMPLRSPNDIKYIRITDFSDDGIREGHQFVTAETVEEKYTLQDEDILFARSGATAGKTFIYTKDIGAAIFAGYCIRFRFDRKKILPWFVYFFTKTGAYQAWVRSIQRPSGQPNINKEEFKSFEISVPSIEVQKQLVEKMKATRTEARRMRASAGAEWAAAKARFERELLGESAKP